MQTPIEQTLKDNNTPKIQSSEYLQGDSYRTFMNSIESTVGFMNTSNQKRLYWVWGSGLIKTILEVIPEDFLYQKDASLAITIPDNFTGSLSWVLYAFRFFFNLTLLVYYTLATDPANPDDDWKKRLDKQWQDKKFALLNDLIWGPANMVCFFFLNAKTGLGMWGDFLTLGLLLFDVSMTVWDYAESEADYLAKLQGIENEIKKKTNELTCYEKNGDVNKKNIAQLVIKKLTIEKQECTADWEAKQRELLLNLLYAFSLVVAFALIIGGTALPPLAIAGTVLCFTFTILNNTLGVGRELYESESAAENAQKKYTDRADRFQRLQSASAQHPDLALELEQERQKLTLELAEIELDIKYQNDLAFYKTAQLIQVIIVQLLVPPLVLASLVFMPTGIGIAMIVIAATLAICSSLLIKEFEPGKRIDYKKPTFFAQSENKDNRESQAREDLPSLGFDSI